MAAAPKNVRDLFLAALERPPAERPAYLEGACAGDAALRQRVEALLGAHDEPGAFLSEATPPAAEDAPTKLVVSEAGVAGRYALQERIGEGGMGVVWVAKQIEPVKRKVALKLIKAGMDTKAVLQRFEAERQALALMDHPNIARVLDGGMTADRRPFFVMELVNGLPLTRFCDEAKLGIRERLELFTAICQAVQHAHQKGIIHRDLKPSNILVTLIDGRPVPKVIDFGVAKAIGGKLLDESLSTQFGAVVGTLEYMAPEQAGYSGSDIDTRADIYSLGVILYELLTGLQPIDAKRLKQAALNEMIRILREEEPSKPSTRLSTDEALASLAASRDIEPKKLMALLRGELDWVVMKCLEKQRERRYETASSLARDIQRYLADEPVEARPPSAAYWLKKFVRRHPLELALAGAVALLLFGGVTVAWWQNQQAGAQRETDLRRQLEDEKRSAADNARLGRNAEAVAVLLGQCEEAVRAAEASKAAVALDAARKRSAEGGADEQAQRLGRLDADLALLRELDAIDQFRWTWSENQFPDPAVVATRTRDALGRFGANPDAVSADKAAARVSASVVRERIVTALDRLFMVQKAAALRAVLRMVDADPYRDAVRDAVLADDLAKLAELAGQEAAPEQPPGFVAFLGASPAINVERRRELLQAAVSRRSGDVGLLMTLGLTYPINKADGVDERLRWFQAAVAAAPGNAAAHSNLGIALKNKGQVDEAIAHFEKALALDPKVAQANNSLGTALYGKGKVDEAIDCFEKAIALDPKFAAPHTNLGNVLYGKGQVDEAIDCYHKALARDPKYAPAHYNLGNVLHRTGQVDYAIDCFKKAIAVDPKLAPAHASLGDALYGKGQVDEAIDCYHKALALDPKNAEAHYNLGYVLNRKGQVNEAIDCYHKAVALDPKLAPAHFNLGLALAGKGKADEAIACFHKVIALDPKDAEAHLHLGSALEGKGQVDEAIDWYRRAIALDPKLAPAHYNLGNSLLKKRQLDEAIDCFKKAIALDPKYAVAHTNLGTALQGKGQVDEAIDCYRRAIALDPKLAPAHYNLGNALVATGQVDEAISSWRKAIALDPKLAKAHTNLGTALQGKGQLDKAIDCFRQAIAIDPKLVPAHFNLGNALVATGQVDEAIASWRQAIALDPKFAKAHTNLGLALLEKGQVDEAIASFKKTIALDPKSLSAYTGLGNALRRKGQLDEVIECYQKVIELAPKDARAHLDLGNALADKGQGDKAIACYRQVIEINPKLAEAHYSLGLSLADKGQVDESIACWRKTIEIDPKFAEAHCNLGHALARQGRFAESLAALKRGHELGTKQPGWPYPSTAWVRLAKEKAAMEAKLPAFLKGEFQPSDSKERRGLAGVCQGKKLHHTATGLYAAAFAADPKSAADLEAAHRYSATCCAALAAAGQGEDAAKLDDKERMRLRNQALDWLRADLALHTKRLESDKLADHAAAQWVLRNWQSGADLAGLRDAAALAKLPAEEQKAFAQLWADVAALLKKAEEKPK